MFAEFFQAGDPLSGKQHITAYCQNIDVTIALLILPDYCQHLGTLAGREALVRFNTCCTGGRKEGKI